ncbi:mechanosensitive ion channel family protein [Denitromonas ohlonensis]|jgi:MscS family membrane protein|uniref:Mechanosensitive ion channel family protein n=2 Tax=Denitromonas TaxID=139331 RepID=A0A557RD88_9RHOO|nr:mechanosensitive ion channel family protein [Denitromonas ohlonensis]TVT45757.1 MAG: mechanosensitive ion channel family protein [Denitromonas halophila]TVO63137.1 mechanosensitive ion channel family protein [Denitromonas ohlonensis]TVO71660.1 mechanosensitive ion channel family protein [Denitromonas ohlonensis]TVT71906.1 MAG: mechanosensitive ion channel family protein [Denitromonas halophila]TVT77058.1 MAG: mechanosensitive ion channel family protein [Denitromonas halophila]
MEHLTHWLTTLGFDATQSGLTSQVFLVVLAVVVANFVISRVLTRLIAAARKTSLVWDDAALEALGRPLRMLIWLLGIAFAADMVGQHTDAPIFDAVDPMRKVGVIALIAWALTRLIGNTEHAIIARGEALGQPADLSTVAAIGKLLRITVIITTALIALQSLGFSISGVLAFGGVGGIAIGFAAKDLLANFFGALMIYLDRPFAIGDWIRSPDKDIEGTVEDIGWRLTRIRRFDKRPLYVPNAIFTQISVENPARMTHRRINETIGIRYDDLDKMQAITDDVRQMLIDHPDIADDQTMIVHFNTFNASSVDFFVYTFTHTTKWVEFHRVKQDVLLHVAAIIDRHGAEIAFPTRTLHLPDGVRVGSAPELERAAQPVKA